MEVRPSGFAWSRSGELSEDAGPIPLVAASGVAAGAATLNYGMFFNHVINFLIVAFAVFLLIRQVNRLKRGEAPAAPTTKDCPFCMMSIPLAAKKCGHCTSAV